MRPTTIVITTVPHARQRYDTLGDWQWRGDDLMISVSQTGDWRADAAIAVHELVEALLCKSAGISQEVVDHFDTSAGAGSPDPGDLNDAPYRNQHCFATAVERMLIAAFGMAWPDYEWRCDQAKK